MGLLDEMKKALFGAKSVAKSAGRNMVNKGRKTGQELIDDTKDKAKAMSKKAKKKAENIFDEVTDFAEEMWQKTEPKETEKPPLSDDPMDDILKAQAEESTGSSKNNPSGEDTPTEPSQLEKIGGQVLDTAEKLGDELLTQGEKFMEKLKDTSKKVGDRIMEETEEPRRRVKEESSRLFDKAKSFGEEMYRKAQEEADKENLDELVEEAKRREAELEQKVKERSQRTNYENLERDRKENPLSGSDSFFDKAKRFAEGDYFNEGKGEEDMTISQDPEYQPKIKEGTVPGFEDLDGDGDEIIDDAIIDEDDKV